MDAIYEWAANNPYVCAVYIFGSRAKGTPRADSDLDIAIEASNGNYTRFDSEWKAELSERTGLRVGLS
jgi:predicted nucleotidyltransferase